LGGFCWIVVEGDRIWHCRLHGPSCNLLPGSHHSGNLNGCVCYKEIWAQFTEISFEFVLVQQGNIGPIHWAFHSFCTQIHEIHSMNL
jgi:hypothetical protein